MFEVLLIAWLMETKQVHTLMTRQDFVSPSKSVNMIKKGVCNMDRIESILLSAALAFCF